MPANPADIVSQIRAHLRVTDPELDTSQGSVTRKIIDAVSESIAGAYVEQHLLSYQYDIDAKIDADLDAFTQLFGIARLAAKRATGTVVFSRASSTATVFIPVNTEIRTTGSPSIAVATVTPAVMGPGETSVTVPVQAVLAGPTGNLAPGTLTVIGSPVDGVSDVTNTFSLTGGLPQETDTELRTRWRRTVFRSLAGTEQMYLGIALDDPDCYAANVIGSSKRRIEQIQIASAQATSQVDDLAFAFDSPVVVGKDIQNGVISQRDYDYTWDTTVNPPKVTVLNPAALPDGTLIDLDFEYVPMASRNLPTSGITNRVDVWCGGTRAKSAQQSVVFQQVRRFTGDSGSRFYNQKFIRPDGTRPVVNNVFVPLAFGPILTIPGTITVGGQVYAVASAANAMGTTVGSTKYAYQIVHDDSAFGYSPSSMFGIEWDATMLPVNGSVFTISQGYTYNSLVHDIEDGINRWRLVGTDAQVHQAKQMRLRFSFAIMYSRSSSNTVVDQAIDTALADHLARSGFNAVVQFSDILQVVHNVPGVDAVRFVAGSDYSGYNSATPNVYAVGIQRVVNGAVVQSYVDSAGRVIDVKFGDNELPVFDSANKFARAQNTWGS